MTQIHCRLSGWDLMNIVLVHYREVKVVIHFTFQLIAFVLYLTIIHLIASFRIKQVEALPEMLKKLCKLCKWIMLSLKKLCKLHKWIILSLLILPQARVSWLHNLLALIAPVVHTLQNMKMLNWVRLILHYHVICIILIVQFIQLTAFSFPAYLKPNSLHHIVIKQVPDTTLSLRCGSMMIDE
ncbi:hypothetical protein BHM03_00009900 [Ensete ventricosum]|nr:hypothetical protein BHM03_00009900 [Ensete ventricosum]